MTTVEACRSATTTTKRHDSVKAICGVSLILIDWWHCGVSRQAGLRSIGMLLSPGLTENRCLCVDVHYSIRSDHGSYPGTEESDQDDKSEWQCAWQGC